MRIENFIGLVFLNITLLHMIIALKYLKGMMQTIELTYSLFSTGLKLVGCLFHFPYAVGIQNFSDFRMIINCIYHISHNASTGTWDSIHNQTHFYFCGKKCMNIHTKRNNYRS